MPTERFLPHNFCGIHRNITADDKVVWFAGQRFVLRPGDTLTCGYDGSAKVNDHAAS